MSINHNKKIIIAMYRTFGIHKGRGYQPSYILKYLTKYDLLDVMYVWRIRKGYNNHLLNSTPFLLLIIAYGLQKINNLLKIKKVGSYLFLLPFFDLYLRYKLRNCVDKTILFNYYPNQKLLEYLKLNNNKIIFYVGQLHPKEWEKILLEEYKKISSKNDFDSLATIKDISRQKPLIKYADTIITMSNIAKKSWKEYENKPIYTVPLGVDLEYFKPIKVKKENKITFLFVGRGTYEKGIQYLIKAWQEVESELNNIQLIIAGGINNAEKDYFYQLINKTSSIKLIGYTEVNQLFAQADVLVHPTLAGGFEKVVLEAMACKLPIITTPPASHFVQDSYNGFIIQCCSISQIKAAIIKLAKNKKLRETFAQKSLEIAKKNNWERFGDEFAKIIKKI